MDQLSKLLANDSNGMITYEYIVNHENECDDRMPDIVENLKRIDNTGQFLASSARFLHAVDRERFAEWIPMLIEGAIDKDKERKYIGSLLEAIWGADYKENATRLQQEDDNFRRIFKRLYPADAIGSIGHSF